MCFSSPKAPALPPALAPSKTADKSLQAGTRERGRSSAGGRKSTILTGPLGLLGTAQTTQKTLLGA